MYRSRPLSTKIPLIGHSKRPVPQKPALLSKPSFSTKTCMTNRKPRRTRKQRQMVKYPPAPMLPKDSIKEEYQERGLQVQHPTNSRIIKIKEQEGSPVQSRHQGEQEVKEMTEKKKLVNEKSIGSILPRASSHNNFHKNLQFLKGNSSRASPSPRHKFVIDPMSRKCNGRATIQDERKLFDSHCVNDQTEELSKINPLDSFQQDLTSIRSYMHKLESSQSSPTKYCESQRKLERSSMFDDSVNVASSETNPSSLFHSIPKRKHKLANESSTDLKSSSIRGKQSNKLQRNSSKYLLNLQRKFRLGAANAAKRVINLHEAAKKNKSYSHGMNNEPQNNLKLQASKRSLRGNYKSPLSQSNHVYGDKDINSKIFSIADKLKKQFRKSKV
ncbi:unnamed protein product [Moneuplotes crassus]|uniref:Uncharacterized protein n=1 Tax=Euplotes crassus TaxID=5936 RepID=A0AAD1XB13_EUPCR|nr:unnamed protein product [Moneuplotes crassus]